MLSPYFYLRQVCVFTFVICFQRDSLKTSDAPGNSQNVELSQIFFPNFELNECIFLKHPDGCNDGTVASDGKYLFLHNSQGLHKIGSGYGDTIKVWPIKM